ncbi:MAG: AraC family transcriptional regulator [Acetobacteraceae bacterium]
MITLLTDSTRDWKGAIALSPARVIVQDIPIEERFLTSLSPSVETVSCSSPCFLDWHPPQDPEVERLIQALSVTEAMSVELARLYAHTLCLAILARAHGRPLINRTGTRKRSVVALPQWRLKRVTNYIEAHMAEPIRLADLAKAAGLTRMYFAAQFRAAVGICPHQYLVRERVRHAQTLLLDSNRTVLDVALSVGFQTQAHFTAVFRRFVGETPHRWRVSVAPSDDRDRVNEPLRQWRDAPHSVAGSTRSPGLA